MNKTDKALADFTAKYFMDFSVLEEDSTTSWYVRNGYAIRVCDWNPCTDMNQAMILQAEIAKDPDLLDKYAKYIIPVMPDGKLPKSWSVRYADIASTLFVTARQRTEAVVAAITNFVPAEKLLETLSTRSATIKFDGGIETSRVEVTIPGGAVGSSTWSYEDDDDDWENPAYRALRAATKELVEKAKVNAG